MKFFSVDWAKELQNNINNNQEYKNSSEGWNWLLILSVKNTNQSLLLDLKNGQCIRVKSADEEDFDNSHYIISAGRETWEKILTGNLSAMQALMMKSLTIDKGSMSDLLPYVNSLKELLNSAMKIQTEFE